MKKEITCASIKIKGSLPRNEIVKKVVNTFIKAEYPKKGKGVTFRYPVENLPDNKYLYIVRPGHKKNFDFKVEVTQEMVLEEGKHNQIALDLRGKRQDDQKKFKDFLQAIEEIYHCSENDIYHLLARYSSLKKAFQTGAEVEILLKIIKWLFIMEDIVYWDVEGRAFLYNYLLYVANEQDEYRLGEAMDKVKDPDRLKSFMKKAGIGWIPYKD
ncbi:MAG: hypothetical protein KAW00_00050 [Dehalococcoidia bacterium]|nr:hypothetical protein [Dehalococcoidia bacterium]